MGSGIGSINYHPLAAAPSEYSPPSTALPLLISRRVASAKKAFLRILYQHRTGVSSSCPHWVMQWLNWRPLNGGGTTNGCGQSALYSSRDSVERGSACPCQHLLCGCPCQSNINGHGGVLSKGAPQQHAEWQSE